MQVDTQHHASADIGLHYCGYYCLLLQSNLRQKPPNERGTLPRLVRSSTAAAATVTDLTDIGGVNKDGEQWLKESTVRVGVLHAATATAVAADKRNQQWRRRVITSLQTETL